MTKGERKKAVALAQTRIKTAEMACADADALLKEAEFGTVKAYRAEQHYEACRRALWDAKDEYNALTKCKAW